MSVATQSRGNPPDHPRGSRHKLKIMLEAMPDDELQKIVRKTMELAKAGNVPPMRLCLQHFGHTRRGEPVRCDIPPLQTANDVLVAMQIVATDVAAGKLTAAEGSNIAKIFDLFLEALGFIALEKRLRAVEKSAGIRTPGEPGPLITQAPPRS